jgi:anthranilate synthase component 2
MTHRLLIVDNYDSFTYNLFHYCETFPGIYVEVVRNDETDSDYASSFDSILFSPGPGLPSGAGNMNRIIADFYQTKKMLGVCLGMQALAEFFGAALVNLPFPMHGRASGFTLCDHQSVLFRGLPGRFTVGRYHSWAVDAETLPSDWIPVGYADDGSLQAMRHVSLPIEAVQFHPESVLTEFGHEMITNWLNA